MAIIIKWADEAKKPLIKILVTYWRNGQIEKLRILLNKQIISY